MNCERCGLPFLPGEARIELALSRGKKFRHGSIAEDSTDFCIQRLRHVVARRASIIASLISIFDSVTQGLERERRDTWLTEARKEIAQ